MTNSDLLRKTTEILGISSKRVKFTSGGVPNQPRKAEVAAIYEGVVRLQAKLTDATQKLQRVRAALS